jgi:high-affinity nickel-transport protein
VLSVLLLGFVIGLRHATDADHVVAVTTIVSRERRLGASARIGALWGLGHTITIFVVGGLIILCEIVVPARVALGAEFGVALMLIALGATNLSGPFGAGRPTEARARASTAAAARARRFDALARSAVRPVVVGVVHGLAGSAAVAVLVLSTLRGARWALAYLAIFGLGTVAGMVLLTTAIAAPFACSPRRFERVNAWLATATSVASLLLGLCLAYGLIAVDGLFSAWGR